jgi:hypothetical protein
MQAEFTRLDTHANRHTLHCMRITAGVLALAWLLDMLGLLPVPHHLMNLTAALGIPVILIPSLICHFTGTDKGWIKYLLLAATEVALLIISTFLTFHTVLLFALPLIYAAQYSNRRMIAHAFLSTVVVLSASVFLGYRYGLCDMNMLLQSGDDPWRVLPLYYILPRCLTLVLFVPVISEISKSIAYIAVRGHAMQQRSETDDFTKFGNRNKYLRMVEEYYPTLERVGVIFWDVDHLKETNDTYGHAAGDELLAAVADCIHTLDDRTHQGFRIGGDEFLLVTENPAEGDLEVLIERFRLALSHKNSTTPLELSSSVGYAIGPGQDIEALVRQADAAMYREKARPAARARA